MMPAATSGLSIIGPGVLKVKQNGVWLPFGAPVIEGDILVVDSNGSLSSTGDPQVVARLEGLGFTVTGYSDNNDVPANINDYKAVVITDSVSGSSAPGAKYRNVGIGILSLNAYCTDEMEWTNNSHNSTNVTQVSIVGAGDMAMPAGMSNGTITTTSVSAAHVFVNTLGSGAVVLATMVGDTDERFAYRYPAGGLDEAGVAVAGRRAYLGLRASGYASSATADYWSLFDSLALYVAGY